MKHLILASLLLVSCTKGKQLGTVDIEPATQLSYPAATQVPVPGCDIQSTAKVEKLTVGNALVGAPAIFRVSVSGCSDTLNLELGDGTKTTFKNDTTYSVTYSMVGIYIQQVKINGLSISSQPFLVSADTAVPTPPPFIPPPPAITPPPTSSFTSFLAITAFQMTPQGTHIPGGLPATESGFSSFGSFADCGNAWGEGIGCMGNQPIYAKYQRIQSQNDATPVIVAFHVTEEGAHQDSPTFPAGNCVFGSIADCGGSVCAGSQILSFKAVPYKDLFPGTPILVNVWMTPEGTHRVGGGDCPRDYVTIGGTADCGGAKCQGNQRICGLFLPK